MTQLVESLERRVQPRMRQELPCVLLVEGCRHRGMVRDISAWGLFVQTPGELPRAADAIVAFRTPEGKRFDSGDLGAAPPPGLAQPRLPQRRRRRTAASRIPRQPISAGSKA